MSDWIAGVAQCSWWTWRQSACNGDLEGGECKNIRKDMTWHVTYDGVRPWHHTQCVGVSARCRVAAARPTQQQQQSLAWGAANCPSEFITVLTTAHHLFFFWAKCLFAINFTVTFTDTTASAKWSFSFGFPHQNFACNFCASPHVW
jgi:hypothetical protein